MPSQLDFLWRVHSNVSEWVRFSDAKAGAILAIHTFMWGIISAGLNSAGVASAAFCSRWFVTLFALFALCSAASVLFALLSIHPTLSVGESNSHIYFAHVAKRRKRKAAEETNAQIGKEFVAELVKLEEPQQVEEVGGQVWANSIVAFRKYKWVSWSLKMLCIAFAFFLATLVASFVVRLP